jgi:quercetin dioxygenase-like cupin family protein
VVRAGEELVNPVTGVRTVFRETARDTHGELLQVEWRGGPEWAMGADHVHPLQEERFEVLAGRLGLRVGGTRSVHRPGEVAVIPPSAPHTAWNAGDEEIHVLVDFRPALRTEALLDTMVGLAREGRTNGGGAPRSRLQTAVILDHFRDEFQFARPPLVARRGLLGPVAALGRLLGLRAEHPQPHESKRVTA